MTIRHRWFSQGARLCLLGGACAGLAGLIPAPTLAGYAIHAVASRGTSAVIVGEPGRIFYAPSAPHNQRWEFAEGTPYSLRAVATGTNDYFAVGDRGRVVRSTDPAHQGSTWLAQTSRTERDLFGIARAASRMVAVGDTATIQWAPAAGGSWILVDPSQVASRKRLRAVASSSEYTVAVGDSGTILWSPASSLSTWYTPSGVTTNQDLHGAALGPGNPSGRFWAVGNGGTILRALPNGQGWEALGSPVSSDLNAITFSPLFPGGVQIGIAVGDGGVILYSSGGQDWSTVDSGTTQNLYGVAYTGSGAGGGFVATGEENTVLWSALGTVWQPALVPIKGTSWGSVRGSWRGKP